MHQLTSIDRIAGGIWGSLVGDALGVPVEFMDRALLRQHPVQGMREFGTHRQPRGTWSDDGSLILCTIESLLQHEYDPEDMGQRFVRWMQEGIWTPHGEVFDIGGATRSALGRIAGGAPAGRAGGRHENSNGNGSLMRILPVALRFANEPANTLINRLEEVSAITHAHDRSRLACVFLGLMTRHLLAGDSPLAALSAARIEFADRFNAHPEFPHLHQVLEDDFYSLPESKVASTGYVLHTLHASLWCLLNTSGFPDCVLRAVNLGGDSDTTGCVAGGLAGVVYGRGPIPQDWIDCLARKNELEPLVAQFSELCRKR